MSTISEHLATLEMLIEVRWSRDPETRLIGGFNDEARLFLEVHLGELIAAAPKADMATARIEVERRIREQHPASADRLMEAWASSATRKEAESKAHPPSQIAEASWTAIKLSDAPNGTPEIYPNEEIYQFLAPRGDGSAKGNEAWLITIPPTPSNQTLAPVAQAEELEFPVMPVDERRTTLINSLRASKSWTTDYATAFVDDYFASPVAQAEPTEAGLPIAYFGMGAEDIELLRTTGMKPEEISGQPDVQLDRVRELVWWFLRLASGNANPKWTRSHAFELVYYIACMDVKRGIDLKPIRDAAFKQGAEISPSDRRMLEKLGVIEAVAGKDADSRDAEPFPAGTPVNKVGGSYQAAGVVVSAFSTQAGEKRYVFEFDQPAGMLHIFGPTQLAAILAKGGVA